MNATLFQTAFAEGSTRAISQLSMPITGLRTAVHNGYLYLGPTPFLGDAEATAARMSEMQRMVMELGPTILADWRERFEPVVLAKAERILGFDYEHSSAQGIARFVQTFYAELAEVWEIHMR